MRKILLVLAVMFAFPFSSFAGWEYDEAGTKYINDDGTIKTGWHQDTDGKWYYLDDETGYMLKNSETPDGFIVSDTGEWIQNTEKPESKFENQKDLSVSGMALLRFRVSMFGYEVPVRVYYNNQYNNAGGGTIEVTDVKVSSAGAPYITISANDISGGMYGIDQIIKYTFDDGTSGERTKMIGDKTGESSFEVTLPLMSVPGLDWDFKSKKAVSAEIFIVEHIPEDK